ncbi:unnamed protein product [Macrosiphum euphorbiae]|uniref:p53 DNA-binding domain-containing protein n=1 Tax=Macrosiphum euphorbiae TaxID=13131 RepID=A0AAV0WEK2_9HEMI|nr:unnamed protein product [Macrosiphum euphorbiae]
MNPTDIIDFNSFSFPMENERVFDKNLLQTKEEVQEYLETCAVDFEKSSPTGILPCQSELGGSANFEVLIDSSSQSFRQKWIYSVTLQKVFIDIDKVLLLNFKCDYDNIDSNMPLFVRAMPMYSSADYLKVPVNRCPIHLSSKNQLNKGK